MDKAFGRSHTSHLIPTHPLLSLGELETCFDPPMKLLCLSLALLLAGGRMLAADDATPIILASQAMQGDTVYLPASKYGKALQWKVSSEKWRQVPNWTPGTGPVPLEAHAAAVAALRWINAQPWASNFKGFDGVDLDSYPESSSPTNPTETRWYYKLSFRVKEGSKEYRLPRQAVVLLDGTVVEPTAPPSSARTHVDP